MIIRFIRINFPMKNGIGTDVNPKLALLLIGVVPGTLSETISTIPGTFRCGQVVETQP
jgi:hypothetical protein